jgi:uncharacterized protein (UPF0147 family)
METNLDSIVVALKELVEDNTVPKNIKTKLNEIIDALSSEDEVSIRINKALNMLDEISDDNNIQAYSRTQIWNIASMLEMAQS